MIRLTGSAAAGLLLAAAVAVLRGSPGRAADVYANNDANVVAPAYIWTTNCGTTAACMVASYWDNSAVLSPKYHDYGRLVDYYVDRSWLDSYYWGPPTVPNNIMEVGMYGWNLTAMANSPNGYRCQGGGSQYPSYWGTYADMWAQIKSEINAGRPFLWAVGPGYRPDSGYQTLPVGHGVTAIGYNDLLNHSVIVFNTWDPAKHWWPCVNGQTWAYVQTFVPGGGSGGQDAALIWPVGGELLTAGTVATVRWRQWGTAIDHVDLKFSSDGGSRWTDVQSGVPSLEGDNTFAWTVSRTATTRAMLRICAYQGTIYLAGDGSRQDFRILVSPLPSLVVSLAATPAAPRAGDQVTYLLSVLNSGTSLVTSVTVSDTVTPLLRGVTTDQPAEFGAPIVASVVSGTRYVWSAAGLSMSAGVQYTFTVTGRLGEVCSPVEVYNVAYVNVVDVPAGPVTVWSNSVGFAATPASVSLAVNKTLDPLVPTSGNPLTYAIIVSNEGTATLTSLIVVDTCSPVVTGVVTSQPPPFGAPVRTSVPLAGTRYVWSASGLQVPPGAVLTFTITGVVGMVSSQIAVSNTAYAFGASACPAGKAGALSPNASFLLCGPLTIRLTESPPAPAVGDQVTYLLTAFNSSTAVISSLTISDTVSPLLVGVTTDQPSAFGPPAVAWVISGTRYVWTGTGLTMPPGTSFTFTITGFVGALCAPSKVSCTLLATVTGTSGTYSQRANVVFPVSPPAVGLTVETLGPPPIVYISDPLVYTIVVRNTGAATLARLTVVDTLMAVFTGAAAGQPPPFGPPVVTSVLSGTRFVWSASGLSLAPRMAFTFTLTGVAGTVVSPRRVSNTVFASGASACGSSTTMRDAVGFLLTPPVVPPGAVSPLTALGLPGLVSLSWAAAPAGTNPVAGYEVWRAACAACPATLLATSPVTGFDDQSAEIGVEYAYMVRAYDTLGVSGPFSATVTAAALPPMDPTPAQIDPWDWPQFHHSEMHEGFNMGGPSVPMHVGWTRTLGGIAGNVAVIGGTIFVGSGVEGSLIALNLVTGAEVWRVATGMTVAGVATDGVRIYVNSSAKVRAYNPVTGALRWTNTSGGSAGGVPVVEAGVVYTAAAPSGRGLVAINAADGRTLWAHPLAGDYMKSAPCVRGDLVAVGLGPGGFTAMRTGNGTTAWTYPVSDYVTATQACVDSVLYGVAEDNYLYALNMDTGALKWRFNLGSARYCTPAVVNGTVFVGSEGTQTFFAVNARTGGLAWSIPLSGPVFGHGVTVANGLAFVGDDLGRLYGINLATRAIAWTVTLQGSPTGEPVIAGNRVIACDSGGTLRVFGPAGVVPPSAPLSLTATGRPGNIALAWSSATPGTNPLTAYEIWRATCASCATALLKVVVATASTYIDFDVVPCVTYTYAVRGVDTAFGPGPFSLPASASIPAPPPDLSVEETQVPASPAAGQGVTYRVVVTNTGASTVTQLTVADTVAAVITGVTTEGPPGFTALGPAQAGGGTWYGWSGAVALVPGAAFTFTVTGTVGSSCGPADVGNTVYVTGEAACTATALTAAAAGFTALPAAAEGLIVVETQSPATPVVGQLVTYRIVVANTGGMTVTSLSVADTVSPVMSGMLLEQPAGFAMKLGQLPGASWYGWSDMGGLVMGPGMVLTFTMTGRVRAVCEAGAVSNTAWVEAATACTATVLVSNATGFTVDPGLPRVEVVGQQETAGKSGDAVTYRVVVTNTGAATITNLEVTDTVSPVVVGQAAAQPGVMGMPVVSGTESGTLYVWRASGLGMKPGAIFTFTVTGRLGMVCGTTEVSNTGYVEAATGCSATSLLTNGVGVEVAAPTASLAVVVAQEPASPGTGTAVTYRIVVTNSGEATVTSLMVTDTLSPVVTGAIVDQPGGFAALGPETVASGTWYGWSGTAPLGPGASFTFTITGTVGVVCVETAVSNSAYAEAGTACAAGATRLESSGAGFVLADQVLGFSAGVSQEPADPAVGESVTYLIVVENTGAATVTNLSVVDTVSAVVTGVVTDQPAEFGAPLVMQAGGTLYVWSAVGLTLSPTGTFTITITGRMGAVCAPVAVSNTAYVTGGVACAQAGLATGPVGSVVQPSLPGLSVALEQEPASPAAGEVVTWRIVVVNTGMATITQLSVADTVSAVVTGVVAEAPVGFAALGPAPAGSGSWYGWSGAVPLAPGSAFTFTVTGRLGAVCAPTAVSNTAWVEAATACTATAVAAGTAPIDVAAPPAALAVEVAQAPESPGVGQPVVYRIVVTNVGEATVTSLRVVDTVSGVVTGVVVDQPGGFTAVGPEAVASGTWYGWSGTAPLSPGASFTFTITGTVGVVCAQASVANTAYVEADTACAVGATILASSGKGFVLAYQVLSFSAAATQTPSSPGTGEAVTYLIVVENTGAATIADLVVTDTVAAVVMDVVVDQPEEFGIPLMMQAGGGTLYVWSAVGLTFSPTGTFTFTITGRMGPVCVPAMVSNTGYVAGGVACARTQAVTNAVGAIHRPASAGLAVATTQTPSSPGVGETVAYRIVVTNTGEATMTSLRVVDTVSAVVIGAVTDQPVGFAAVVGEVAGATWYGWSDTGGLVMGPGVSFTFTLTGRIGSVCVPMAVSNTVWVAGGADCSATSLSAVGAGFTAAPGTAGLSVVKAVTPAAPAAGQQVTYRIVVTNTGDTTLTDLSVTDTVSAEVTEVVTETPAGFVPIGPVQLAGGTWYAWSGAGGLSIPPGASFTFTLTGVAGFAAAPKAVSNTAYAAGWSGCGGLTAAVGAAGFGLVPPPPFGLSVVETQDPANPNAGAEVVYRIVLQNTGGTIIRNLTLMDLVDAVVTSSAPSAPATFAPPSVISVPGSGTRYLWSATGLSWMPGVVLTFTISGRVGGVCASDVIANSAWVNAGDTMDSAVLTSNEVSFNATPAALSVAASQVVEPSAPTTGGPVVYRIVVCNTGSATVRSVAVCDTVSPMIEIGAVDQPPAFPAATRIPAGPLGTLLSWSAGAIEMPPGATFTFTVSGTVAMTPVATGVSNVAVVSAASACDSTGFLTNATTFGANPGGWLSVTAETGTSEVKAGGPFLVKMTVVNTGSVAVTGVIPSIVVEAGDGLAESLLAVEPAGPVTIEPGQSMVFVWAFSAVTPGQVEFSCVATGADAVTGHPVSGSVTLTATIAPGMGAGGGWAYVVSGKGYVNVQIGETVTIVAFCPSAGTLNVDIYSLAGVFVRRFTAEMDGVHEKAFKWEGRDRFGTVVPTGGYAAVCRGPGLKRTVKLAVLR